MRPLRLQHRRWSFRKSWTPQATRRNSSCSVSSPVHPHLARCSCSISPEERWACRFNDRQNSVGPKEIERRKIQTHASFFQITNDRQQGFAYHRGTEGTSGCGKNVFRGKNSPPDTRPYRRVARSLV